MQITKSPLVLERIGNRLWVVREPFSVSIKYDNAAPAFDCIIPAGFITDGASVPRIFWSVCPPMSGPFGEAAVVHDFLYSALGPEVSKEFADDVLIEIGRSNGASIVECTLVYLAVRIFGFSHFKIGADTLSPDAVNRVHSIIGKNNG